MSTKTWASVSLGILLAACSATEKRWVRAGATAEDFHRDSYECARENSGVRRSFAPFSGYSEGTKVNEDLYRACLTAKGYQRVETDPSNGWEGLD